MRNSPVLPYVSIVVAAILGVVTLVSYFSRSRGDVFSLSELEIGLVAVAFTLLIFATEGLISVLLEGRELHLGRVRPRLTNPLSLAIVAFSLLLFAVAIGLSIGLINGWDPEVIGLLAGVGCIDLALLLVFYKEAFVGDEAHFDHRDDGVPW